FDSLDELRVRDARAKLRVGPVDAGRNHQRTDAREQRPQAVVDREQMTWPSAGGDRNGDFPREGILGQQVEEDLEESAVGGAINRSAHDHNSRIEYALDGARHRGVLAPAEEGVGGERGEIDQAGRTGSLPLECRERELEQG